MDKKTMIAAGIGAAITFVVGFGLSMLFGLIGGGMEKKSEDQIRIIVKEMMKTPSGKSLVVAIEDLNTNLTKYDAKLQESAVFRQEIRSDIRDIRSAMLVLASD